MNQEYYIQIMGRDAGPFTLEEMYQLIRQGTIQNTTQVRLQDQTQPAFAYTELQVLLELQAAPAPTQTAAGTVSTAVSGSEPQVSDHAAAEWTPGTMLDLFCVYNWIAGILAFLSILCIFIPAPVMIIGGLLSIPISLVHLTIARMCRRNPYAALRMFTWMFFICLIPNLLSVIGFLLELPFVCYYFANKDRLPRK